MAGRNNQNSSFLANDQQIYDFSETIDAPRYYEKLGMDLLGSQAEISSIIGVTDIDYSDVVYRCLIDWRNANGIGDGQCRELIMILKECGLTDVASWLEEKQGETRKCLSKDGVLLDISSMIDGPKYYEKLGLKLVESEVRLSNIVGKNAPPCYKTALYQCLIKFRNQEGSSMATARKLREILIKRRLSVAAAMLEELEPGLCKDEEANDNNSGDVKSMGEREPEAGL